MTTMIAASTLHPADYIVLFIYMALMIGVGVRFTGRDRTTDEYLLGGRSIPWWLAGISYLMTLLSTISMVAIPGQAYSRGITMVLQTLILPIVSIAAFHIFIRFYFRAGTFTPFDYLERRFDPRVRLLAASFFWITRVIYMGVALYATSLVFQGACGWDNLYYTILLAGGFSVVYTLLGGLHAVTWTDFLQFLILVGGMGVLVAKILWAVPGGALGVITYAFENGRGVPEITDPNSGFFSLSPFVPLTLWGLILFMANDHLFYNSADQMAIQRLLSTSNYQQAKKSLYSCLALQVPVFLMLWFVGLAIFAFYGQVAPDEAPVKGDHALYQFIGTQLPTPLPGLMVAAMLAAVMSTVSGGFNSLATVATIDVYRRFIRPDATQAQQVAFSRWTTLSIGAGAIAMGMLLVPFASESMIETSFVWLSLVAGLPPVFLLGVFSRRARTRDALLALAIACTVTAAMIVLHLRFQDTPWEVSFLWVCIPGPVLALLTACLITRFSPPLPDEQLAGLTFYTVNQHALQRPQDRPAPTATLPVETEGTAAAP